MKQKSVVYLILIQILKTNHKLVICLFFPFFLSSFLSFFLSFFLSLSSVYLLILRYYCIWTHTRTQSR